MTNRGDVVLGIDLDVEDVSFSVDGRIGDRVDRDAQTELWDDNYWHCGRNGDDGGRFGRAVAGKRLLPAEKSHIVDVCMAR
jgi:hypothetical protein